MESNIEDNLKKRIETRIALNIEKKGLTVESAKKFFQKLENYGIEISGFYPFAPNISSSNLTPFVRRLCKYKAFSIESAIPLEVLFEDKKCIDNSILYFLRDDTIRHTLEGEVFLNINWIFKKSVIIGIVAIITTIFEFIFTISTSIWFFIFIALVSLIFWLLFLKPLILYGYYKRKFKDISIEKVE